MALCRQLTVDSDKVQFSVILQKLFLEIRSVSNLVYTDKGCQIIVIIIIILERYGF